MTKPLHLVADAIQHEAHCSIASNGVVTFISDFHLAQLPAGSVANKVWE